MVKKTPEKQNDLEELVIQGDTLKMCRHRHSIGTEACSQLKVSTDTSTQKQLFAEKYEDITSDNDDAHATYEMVPQNQLGILGIDDSWDFKAVLMAGEDKTNIVKTVYTQPSGEQFNQMEKSFNRT